MHREFQFVLLLQMKRRLKASSTFIYLTVWRGISLQTAHPANEIEKMSRFGNGHGFVARQRIFLACQRPFLSFPWNT
jgi:hypothetical protein